MPIFPVGVWILTSQKSCTGLFWYPIMVTIVIPRWAPFIKEYDGGTLMECEINFKLAYTDISGMVRKYRQQVCDRLKAVSHSHIVYEGLQLRPGCTIDVDKIPGLHEIKPDGTLGRKRGKWAISDVPTSSLVDCFERVMRSPHGGLLSQLVSLFTKPEFVSPASTEQPKRKDQIDPIIVETRLKERCARPPVHRSMRTCHYFDFCSQFYRSKKMLLADLNRMISYLRDWFVSNDSGQLDGLSELERLVQEEQGKP